MVAIITTPIVKLLEVTLQCGHVLESSLHLDEQWLIRFVIVVSFGDGFAE
jgi:hypothetical protein